MGFMPVIVSARVLPGSAPAQKAGRSGRAPVLLRPPGVVCGSMLRTATSPRGSPDSPAFSAARLDEAPSVAGFAAGRTSQGLCLAAKDLDQEVEEGACPGRRICASAWRRSSASAIAAARAPARARPLRRKLGGDTECRRRRSWCPGGWWPGRRRRDGQVDDLGLLGCSPVAAASRAATRPGGRHQGGVCFRSRGT